MSKKIWVVITGLIRKPDYFVPTLETLVRARELGLIQGIVFSTWVGEVDAYGLRQALMDMGVVLVESPPLQSATADLAHNIERQKLLFYWGLTFVPPEAHVFKTRPDQVITINEKFLNFLSHLHSMDLSVAERDRDILPARVWCGRFAPNTPFWYDDRYFFTTHEVAMRMTAMSTDLRLLAHPKNNIAEANWYQPLFSRTTFWANAMMRVNWHYVTFILAPETFETYKGELQRTDFFWLVMALYEQVTDRFILSGYTGFDLADYDYLGADRRRKAEVPMQYGGRFIDFFPNYPDHPKFQYARGLCEDLRGGAINDPALWRKAISDLIAHSPHLSENIFDPVVSNLPTV